MREGSSSWGTLELTKRCRVRLSESEISTGGDPGTLFASPGWFNAGKGESTGASSSVCLSHSRRLELGDPGDLSINGTEVGYIGW